MMDYLLLLSI